MMAVSPLAYFRAALGFNPPAAEREGEGDPIGPIREASPEDDNAAPDMHRMVSRSNDSSWFPTGYLKTIATNDDTVLARDGTGLKLYDALLDDDVAMSAMQQRRMAITSRDWEVTPGDENDPRSVKAADDFRAMLAEVGLDRVTGLLHFGVWYGYAVGEGLYTTKMHDGRLIVWLDDVIVPDRRWFGFTCEGELRFMSPLMSTIEGEELPPNKFLTIRTGGTHDFAFYGLGLAHWAYWPIFFKRSALKFWALYLEKFGMPTVAIGFPETEREDKVKLAARLEAAVAVGQDRAVLVPEATLRDNQLQLIEAERTGAGSSSYKDFVGEQNEALMRIVLGQPGTMKGVSSGLNSNQAGEHAEVKAEIVKADSDLICEAIERTFAKWITRWNHGEDVKPPKLRRILEDAEDIDTIADRDVKLDGIGIKRTKESVAEVYGDGYELIETPPPPTAAEIAAAGGKLPGLPAPANDAQAQGKARVAKMANAFDVDDLETLYVSRRLLNTADLAAWAKGQGFGAIVPDLHVTILYSKTPVDWFAMGDLWLAGGDERGNLTVKPGGPRTVERFGNDGDEERAVVLRFDSSELRYRHESMIERGASSDYPDYKPHITISYDAADVDLDKVEPYTGELRFGPEIFEPIKSSSLDPALIAFSADEDAAIERLISALTAEASPVFEAMAGELRTQLQGVTTLEGARVAILGAMEQMPIERLANLTALPLLAERAGALVGADDLVDA